MLDKVLKVVAVTAFILGILFFTPIGGIVKVLVGGVALIGAAVLMFNAIFDSDGLKDTGIKLSFAVALLGVAIVVSIVLPSLPSSLGPSIEWDGRGNPRSY